MGKAKSSYYYKSCLQICLALPCIAADCHPRPFLRMVLDSCADFMKSLANYTPNALPAAELRPQDRWPLRAPGGGVLPGQGRDPPGAQAFAPKADEAQARQRGRCTPSASATGSRGSLWPLPISLRPLLLPCAEDDSEMPLDTRLHSRIRKARSLEPLGTHSSRSFAIALFSVKTCLDKACSAQFV